MAAIDSKQLPPKAPWKLATVFVLISSEEEEKGKKFKMLPN